MAWLRQDTLTIEGVGYQGGLQNQAYAFPAPGSGKIALLDSARLRGGHFLSHWTHRFSPSSSTDILGYCDWTDRISFATEARNTCQLEFQHSLQIRSRHSLVWGANAITSKGITYQSFEVQGVPVEQRSNTESVFGQYDLAIIPDRLRLIAGAKLEHNSYTGLEIQPQIRGVWSPQKAHTLWAALSRAVRIPTRMENQEQVKLTELPFPVLTYLTVVGNPKLKAEVLRAYEVGYRFEPAPAFSLDAALFYNHYDNLSNVNLADPLGVAGSPIVHQNPTYLDIPVPWQNLGAGQTHGAELYAKSMPLRRWMLAAAVTELRGNSVNLADALNLPLANTPKHQSNLQSRLNLTPQIEFDSALFHYDGIPGFLFGGIPFQDVPTHNRIDAGIAFHRRGGFIFSVWAHDLASDRHWENRPVLFTTTGSQTGPSIVFHLSWRPQPER